MTLFLVVCIMLLFVGLWAFRLTRVLCLHLLVFAAFFIVLPAIVSLAPPFAGRPGVLAGRDLAESLIGHWYLYAAYGVGLLGPALLFNDRKTLERAHAALASQQIQRVWILAIYVGLAADLIYRWRFNIVIIGSGNTEATSSIPYLYKAVFAVIGTINFGLFCYSALFSRSSRLALLGCAVFACFMLVAEGRRAFLMCLVVFFTVRIAQITFRLTPRYALVGGVAIAMFLIITPIFIGVRTEALSQSATGVPQFEALVSAIGTTLAGDQPVIQTTAGNIAERGNAGVFLLSAASFISELSYGEMIFNSLLWQIPSTLAEKPPLPVEQMIQLAMRAPLTDDASSPQTVFFADFGWPGVLLAGIYMSLTLYLFARLIGRGGQFGLFEIAVLGAFFFLSCSAEIELSGQFATFRNIFLIWIGVLAFRLPAAAIERNRAEAAALNQARAERLRRGAPVFTRR